MIKIFNKTYKIRLVGPFCSRDYFHAFPHCIELIIDVASHVYTRNIAYGNKIFTFLKINEFDQI